MSHVLTASGETVGHRHQARTFTMPAAVDGFDDAVDRAFDRLRRPSLDHLFYALSSAADHSMLWHGIGIARGWATGDRRSAKRMATALGTESFLTNVVVKSQFRRTRPPRDLPDGDLPYGMRVPITSSFPSGHATAAFTAAAFLSETGVAPAWYTLAALVAASRVYVRMHHASDVVAGAALGVALGAILRRVLR